MKEKNLWNLKILYIIFEEIEIFISDRKKERNKFGVWMPFILFDSETGIKI